ncbi:MAG: CpaF family protein [Tepidisphaeraceae bacterium]
MQHASDAGAAPIAGTAEHNELRRVKRMLVERLLPHIDTSKAALSDAAGRQSVLKHLPQDLAALGISVPQTTQEQLFQQVIDELFGLGPIQPLLDDPSVTEIMVNRADRVYVERKGKPVRLDITFDDDAHVRRIIDRIIVPLGRRLDETNPLVDARLPDGSRVNAVIPPVAVAGSCLTIRKFSKTLLTFPDLINLGTLTPLIAEFLKVCVIARLNIIVTGGSGSGKTTLLNVLSACIPDDERIVTIEDAAELKLFQDHVITLEAQPPDAHGQGEVTIRDLVRNALRMRPERIIVGECRGAEALDMLQAMNTGHDGSLTTLHANAPRDAISRIETMALMAGIEFPVRVIREQIGSAVQMIVHESRMRDGSRKITHICELAGMEGDRMLLQDIFRFKEEPAAANAPVRGSLQPSGLRPGFITKLEAIPGLQIPRLMFTPGPHHAAHPTAPAPDAADKPPEAEAA